ncbi:MAG: type II secretion system F family protein [Opitutales bacterium]|nr:type II secretion system F family protein [Opitutales bacterium]
MSTIFRKSWETAIESSHQTKDSRFFIFGNRISKKQLSIYTRQLSTLLKAGVPMVQALKVMLRQDRSEAFKKLIGKQIADVESGISLSTSMKRISEPFDSMYVHLVVAGERAGVLHQVLSRLAHYLERREQIAGKVKAALTYPVVVLLASISIVSALLVFVVPQFEEIFETMLKGAPLPQMTRWVLGVSAFFQDHWISLFVGSVALGVFLKLVLKVRQGAYFFDWLKLNLPMFGQMSHRSILARFCRTLGILLESAVPILEAMDTANRTLGNQVMEEAGSRVRKQLLEGDSVASQMEIEKSFPPMMVGMIEVGEATGELPSMLIQIAEIYEQEVEVEIDGMTTLIEPVMILLLAVIIGFLVISLFLPIVEIMQQMSI